LLAIRSEDKNQMHLLRGIKVAIPSLFLLCFGALTIARADTVTFAGSRYEKAPAASPGGRCAPALTLIINSSVGVATGTSNLGAFTVDENACFIAPFPISITDGVFTFTFDDGDTLTGTFSGIATRVNIPTGHLLTINQDYIITGGTGSFIDATGNISETGTGMSTGIYAINNYTFDGTITAPDLRATPEPATLALLSTGLAGGVLKFRRARKARAAMALRS
jgi:hypothetical protein